MSTIKGPHSTIKKRKVVNVVLLNKEEFTVYVDVKSKFREVFNLIVAQLGLRETEYFGVALKIDGEFHFVPLEDKIHKHAPKGWKSGQGEGIEEGHPLVTLYFRVQYYVDQVVLLRERTTRYQYYLQLRENVLNYRHFYSEEKCFQLVAYALQTDYGSYTPSKHRDGYFDPRNFFPSWMLERRGVSYLIQNAPLIHQDLSSVARTEAELRFIREASNPPATHNLHFYRLKKKKSDIIWNAWFGVCAKGIEIYEEIDGGFKNLISTFLWPDIGKLYHDKKKFEIRSTGSRDSRKFSYYTDSDAKSKYLLSLCRNTHMFQMAIQPKLLEIKHLDAEDKRRYRESYIYSDAKDLVANGGLVQLRTNMSPGKSSTPNNRFSVISDASSNTTSGIVSDKMAISFEENEDHREIMIDCPPRSNLHGTPSQIRSKLNGVQKDIHLHNFKQISLPNRSPVMDTRAHDLPRSSLGKPGSSPVQSNHVRVQHDLSPVSSNGSYRQRLKQQQQLFFTKSNPYMPDSGSPTRKERSSKPVSRSVSHGDRFKNTLSQLQQHNKPVITNSCNFQIFASGLKSPNVLEMHNHATKNDSIIQTSLPLQEANVIDDREVYSPPTSLKLGSSIEGAERGASASIGPPQAVEKSIDSGIYTNTLPLSSSLSTPTDNQADDLHNVKVFTSDEENDGIFLLGVKESDQGQQTACDLWQINETLCDSSHDVSFDGEGSMAQCSPRSEHDDGSMAESSEKRQKKATHISVKNQKEILHPELEEIRGQEDSSSLPFMSALCKDWTLMHAGSDTLTSKSSDSRLSRSSHDIDVRRFSSCFPASGMDTMITLTSRPFSWHSEHFDLQDHIESAQKQSMPTMCAKSRNNNSETFKSDISTSWTKSLLECDKVHNQSRERYSPEMLASQHNIPTKLTSGGHNKNESNIGHINHKTLTETVGLA